MIKVLIPNAHDDHVGMSIKKEAPISTPPATAEDAAYHGPDAEKGDKQTDGELVQAIAMRGKGPDIGHAAPQQKGLKEYGCINEQGVTIPQEIGDTFSAGR